MSEKTEPKPLHGLSPLEDWIAWVNYLESELGQAREQLKIAVEALEKIVKPYPYELEGGLRVRPNPDRRTAEQKAKDALAAIDGKEN